MNSSPYGQERICYGNSRRRFVLSSDKCAMCIFAEATESIRHNSRQFTPTVNSLKTKAVSKECRTSHCIKRVSHESLYLKVVPRVTVSEGCRTSHYI